MLHKPPATDKYEKFNAVVNMYLVQIHPGTGTITTKPAPQVL